MSGGVGKKSVENLFLNIIFQFSSNPPKTSSKMKFIIASVFLLIGVVRTQTTTCPAGWQGPSQGGKCYNVYKNAAAPWDAAAKVCADNGGELGSVENQGEQTFLENNVYSLATDWLVTGGRRNPVGTGSWQWTDGSAMTFSNPGSPPLNSNTPTPNINYLYIYLASKGTANYGKTFIDTSVPHQILCQVKAKPTPLPATCGAGCNGGNCGGCGCCGGCGSCGGCGCGC